MDTNPTPEIIVTNSEMPQAHGPYIRADEILPGDVIWILVDGIAWLLGVNDVPDEEDPGYNPDDLLIKGTRFFRSPHEGDSFFEEIRVTGNPLIGKFR